MLDHLAEIVLQQASDLVDLGADGLRLEASLAEVRDRIAVNDCELRRLVAERHRRNETSSHEDVFAAAVAL